MQPIRTSILKYIAMALLAAGVGGAAWADEAVAVSPFAPGQINVRGRVLVRGSINPVPSALLTTSTGQTTTTDEHGNFALALPEGDVEIAISEPQHQPLRLHETVRPGVGLKVEYLLLPLP